MRDVGKLIPKKYLNFGSFESEIWLPYEKGPIQDKVSRTTMRILYHAGKYLLQAGPRKQGLQTTLQLICAFLQLNVSCLLALG